MINVVAALITRGSKVLIAKRKTGNLAGLWEFPGGKIEDGETPEESLIREIREELMVEIKVKGYFHDNIHQYEDKTVRLIAYLAEILEGEIQLKDHDSYLWVGVDEINISTLAPADIPFVEKLRSIEELPI